MSPSPAPSSYRSNPPYERHGPPDWLHPQWGQVEQVRPDPPPRVISDQAISALVLIRALADRRNCPSFTPHPGCGCTGDCGRENYPLNPSAAECRACLWTHNPLHHRDDAQNHEHQGTGDTLTTEPPEPT